MRLAHLATDLVTARRAAPVDDLENAERVCLPVDDPADPAGPVDSTVPADSTDPADATDPAGPPGPDGPSDPIGPPAIPEPTVDPGPFVLDRVEASRFLAQATFGPSLAAIDALVAGGSIDAWITDQMALPMSATEPYVRANGNGSLRPPRHHIWWSNAVHGDDQLRQRVAFALSEIFVVSDDDYEIRNAQYGLSGYYDMLAEEAFGSFRTLLERVTLHPIMGIFLSMLRNEKADPERNIRPDENYAREVLQLFSIGLYELTSDGRVRTDASGDPIPTYDQETVEQFAKVFTGWDLADSTSWTTAIIKFDKERPMVPVEAYHDTSAKTLLSTALPAGQSARTDMEAALDDIVAHPNVGPFIARALIQRLVTSNPKHGYVGRVAAVFDDNGAGERGDLGAVVRAVLVDSQARSGHRTLPATFGKVKEPAIRLLQVWRAFDAQPGTGGIHRPKASALIGLDSVIGQGPLRSPSVFNFFRPDHPLEPGAELVAPETQILSEIGVASMNNLLHVQIYSNNSRVPGPDNITQLDIEAEVARAGDAAALVDHLDLLLASGSLPDEFRASIIRHVESIPTDADGLVTRTLDAIFCVVGSPFHLVQK